MTADAAHEIAMTAVAVVDRQLEAYNARDLARFVAAYSDTVVAYRMPATVPSHSGKEEFGAFYATQRFNLPHLRAEIRSRIVCGNKVADHERIFGIREAPIEALVVYEVIGGLIERVWLYAPE